MNDAYIDLLDEKQKTDTNELLCDLDHQVMQLEAQVAKLQKDNTLLCSVLKDIGIKIVHTLIAIEGEKDVQ